MMAVPRTGRSPFVGRRTLIVVAVAGAVAWAWWRLPPAPAPSGDASPTDGTRIQTEAAMTVPRSSDPLRESPTVTKLRELRAMSETFRNTTFLGAIRAAGFVCYSLENVYGGVNDSTTWTVSCADMLAYTVSVDGAGALVVEPTMQFLDSAPVTSPRDQRPPPQQTPRQLLPPQR